MGGIGKTEFESGEALYLAFEPFIDPTQDAGQAAQIYSGDSVTFYITKPDASTTTASPTRNGNGQWIATISTGSYQQGAWSVKAVSSDGSAPFDQHRIYHWGTGAVEDVLTTKTRLGAPVGASISADIAAVYSRLGAPAGASLAADLVAITAAVVAVGTDTTAIIALLGTPEGASLAADVQTLRKLLTNKREIDRTNNTVTVYQDDSTTPWLTATLQDELGTATVGTLKEGDVHRQTRLA